MTASVSASTRFSLQLSENPFSPLPIVARALDECTRRANSYPEFFPDRLRAVIARHEGVGVDCVVAGSGATGVAVQVLRSMASRGQTIVHATPTFDGYPIMASLCDMDSVVVPLDADGSQNLVAMADAVDDRTGVIVVCNPHNPTGTVISAGRLETFLCSVPPTVTVILDEAYVEFVDPSVRTDTHAMIQCHRNVIVVRTFSKAYGLAGLRIGYGLACSDLAADVRRHQLPFGIHAAAEAAVTASYAAESELAVRISTIVAERERMRSALAAIGVVTPASHANFLYLPGAHVGEALDRAGIRSRRYPNGDARITVGDPCAGRAVLDALSRHVSSARAVTSEKRSGSRAAPPVGA